MHRILLLLSFCFSFSALFSQAEDDCSLANALLIGPNVSTNVGSTNDPAQDVDLIGACVADISTVWYQVMVGPNDIGFSLSLNAAGVAAPATGNISLAVLDACGGNIQISDTGDDTYCDLLSNSPTLNYTCLSPGTYWVQIATAAGDEGGFNLNYSTIASAVPFPYANENCGAGAVPVSAATPGVGSNVCADNAGDFITACAAGDDTNIVWFSYVVPTGVIAADFMIDNWLTPTGATTALVYVSAFQDCGGTLYNSPTPQDCFNPAGGMLSLTCLTPGETIFLSVGTNAASAGSFEVSVSETAGTLPPNDDCTILAEDLNLNGLSMIAESNLCSTPDVGPNCSFGNATHTVWYTYTVQANVKSIQLNLENWNLPAGGSATEAFAVALTDCTSGNYYQNDPALENCAAPSTNFLEINCPTEGDQIFFSIGSNEINSGTFDISITEIGFPTAPNCAWNETCDIVAAAPVILDNSFICRVQSVNGCNLDACPDPDQAALGCPQITDNPTTWHALTIPTNVPPITSMNIDITGALGDPVFSVYEGACNALTTASLSDGMGGAAGPMPTCITTGNQDGIAVVEGNTYLIPISTNGSAGDNYSIDIELIAPPVNDECDDAIDLSATGLTHNGTTQCADNELPISSCAANESNQVWYSYTAPADILAIDLSIVGVTAATFAVEIGTITACNPTSFITILPTALCTRPIMENHICVNEGVTYHFAVSTAEANATDFDITITEIFESGCTDNDDCDEAEDITGGVDIVNFQCMFQPFPGCNLDACPNPNVFTACGGDMNPVVWHTITAPADALQMIVQVNGTTLANPILGVFTGGTPANCDGPFNAAVAGSDCITGNMTPTDPIGLNVTGGDQFLIAVGSATPAGGDYDLEVLFVIPPDNDDPCIGAANDPEDLTGGGGALGTTCCAIGNADMPFPPGVTEYANNPNCGASTEDDAVWYVYTPDLSFDGVQIDVTAGSITGNVTVEAYIGDVNAGCAGFGDVAAFECASLPAMLTVSCFMPGDLVYVKVGGEELNCGTFNISMQDITNCDFADECDEIGAAQVMNPITDTEGAINYDSCAPGCLDLACPETTVSECASFSDSPTIWFEIQTDLDAEQLYVQVVPNGSWTPAFTIYQGDCSNLTPVAGGTLADPVTCSTDDSTPQVSNVAVVTDVGGNPIQTYYVAVSADGVIDDPTFEICSAATIGIVACIGGIPPDFEDHTCDPIANFEVTVRENEGPLTGPFCSGELLTICFDFLYDASLTVNDWLHGIIPTFGEGWDLASFDPTAITVAPGGAQWFDEGVTILQEDVVNLCTFTDANGNLKLCSSYCEACPCSGTLPAGSPLPGGWFWVTGGGAGCANTGLPQDGYGIQGGVQVNVNFCVDLRVRDFSSEAECLAEGDLSFSIKTFSDGVTGCWDDPLGECRKDITQYAPIWEVECDTPPGLIATPQPQVICNMGNTGITVNTVDNTTASVITVTVQDNPNVTGETGHGPQNAPLLVDDFLTNTSTVPQVVVYTATSEIPGLVCPGPEIIFEVLVNPQIVVEGEEEICEGLDEANPTLIANTMFGVDPVSFVWNPLSSSPSGVSTQGDGNGYLVTQTDIAAAGGDGMYEYEVTVTDALGCTGVGIVTLTVFPEVFTEFPDSPYEYCTNDPNPFPVIVPSTPDGTPGYQYFYNSTGFGLSGGNLGDGNFTVDLPGSIGGDPVIVEVITQDSNGCTHESSFTVQIIDPLEINEQVLTDCGAGAAILNINVTSSTPGVNVDQVVVEGPAGNIYQAGGPIHNGINITSEGTYTITATNQQGICPATKMVIIDFLDIEDPVLTPDQIICEGDVVTLEVINPGDYNGFLWNDPAGSTTAGINVSPTTNTTYTVQVTNDENCSTTASVEVTVNPNPTISFSGATNFCPGTMTIISAGGDATSDTYTWTGPGFVTNATDPSAIDITVAGLYSITITDSNNCTAIDEVNVIEGGTITTTVGGNDICDSTPVDLDAGAGFLTYLWQIDDGTGIYLDAPMPNDQQIYSTAIPGNYQVLITQGGCDGSGTITIDQFNSPDVNVTPAVTICDRVNTTDSTYVDFNAQVTGLDQSGVWADVDFAGVDLTTDLSNVDFLTAGVAPGSYDFTFTTNTATAPCVDEVYTMTVEVLDCACPNLDSNDPAPMCSTGGTILLSSLEIPFVTAAGTWTWISSPSNSMINTPATDFTSAGMEAGEYIFEFTVDTPGGSDCEVSQQDTIVVFDPPTATIQMTEQTCNVNSPIGGFLLDFTSFVGVGSDPGDWVLENSPMGTAIDLTTLTSVSFENVPLGDYEFSYTTNNAVAPCQNQSYAITISVVDCNCPVNPMTDPLCNDSDMIDLSTLVLMGAPAGTWSVTAGPAGHSASITGTTFDATDNLAGMYTVTFTLTDAGLQCDVPLTVVAAPLLTVTPAGDACSDVDGDGPTSLDLTSYILTGDATGTNWTSDCGLDFSDPTNVSFIGVADGICTITYTTPDDPVCGTLTETIEISVTDCLCPNLDVGTVTDQCNQGALAINLAAIEGPNAQDGTWFFESGPQSITIDNDFFDANGVAAGEYIVYFQLDNPKPGCPDTSQVSIMVDGPMIAGIPEAPLQLCLEEGDVVILGDLLTGEDAGGVWIETSIDGSTGTAFDPISGTFSTNGQLAGTYTFAYTLSDLGPCPDVEETVTVIIEGLPTADAGSAAEFTCTISDITIGGASSTGTTISYFWSESTGVPLTNNTSITFDATVAGTYILEVTDEATGCISTDSVVIGNNDDQPQITVESSDPSCFGVNDGLINVVTVTGGDGNYEYSIDGGATWQTSQQFANLDGGSYIVTVQDGTGCSNTDSAELDSPVLFDVEISVPSGILQLGEPSTLTIEAMGIADDDIANMIITENETIIYEGPFISTLMIMPPLNQNVYAVTIFDANDCNATAIVNIEAIELIDIFIPNIFSPNGDNTNDNFTVFTDKDATVDRFLIYDRWGELVYVGALLPTNDPSQGWNGIFKGEPVEQGVYVYVVDITFADGQQETREGDVTVLR